MKKREGEAGRVDPEKLLRELQKVESSMSCNAGEKKDTSCQPLFTADEICSCSKHNCGTAKCKKNKFSGT